MPEPRSRTLILALAAALVAALAVIAFLLLRHSGPGSAPEYHLLTYRRGTIRMARFAPDGQTVVYSAAWEGGPVEIFSTRFGTPESRPVGAPGAEILGISSTGEMAVLLQSQQIEVAGLTPALWRACRWAAARRAKYLENIQWADWSPDGSQFLPSCAISRGGTGWSIRRARCFTKPEAGSVIRAFRARAI